MGITAKLFINGRNQAVRIPQEFAFRGVDAVTIEKKGKSLVLSPVRSTWSSLADLPAADDDFMRMRPRLIRRAPQQEE